MDNKKDLFQYAMIGGFLLLAVIAVIVFATYRGTTSTATKKQITVWGTLPQSIMTEITKTLADAGIAKVLYTQISSYEYYGALTQAFAEGRGPDLYMIDQTALIHEKPKLTHVSYETLSERTFLDTYADGAGIFRFSDGIYALPFSVDPLIMYWNKDYFANEGLVVPPKYWDEFLTLVPKLTKRGQDGKILKSTIALGTYKNITNAKAILSTLLLQAGSPITQWTTQGQKEELKAALAISNRKDVADPVGSAIRFYTQFSNSVSNLYSWHEAMPESRDAFLAGDLAVYFGFASEASQLRSANPNLNFDIATIPQARNASRRMTYARIYAFAIPKASKDPQSAYAVATVLSSAQAATIIANKLGLPPLRRDLLSKVPGGAYWSVAYDSAIISKGWLEPDPLRTTDVLEELIESVISGRESQGGAITVAGRQLEALAQ